MRTSVSLCTYNGARYLREQLDSLAAQSRLPDELIVCDDRSSDDVPAILDSFARTAPFPVIWSINPKNLGVTLNFEQAVSRSSGELIALCDQDDVWHPNKLAVLEKIFQEDPEVILAASDGDLIDSNGNATGRRLWATLGFTLHDQRRVTRGQVAPILLRRPALTGAAMAFRARLLELSRPFSPLWVHDEWLAFFAGAVGAIHLVSEPLIGYRVHPTQTIGLGSHAGGSLGVESIRHASSLGSNHFDQLAAGYRILAERLDLIRTRLRDPSIPALVQSKALHFQTRARIRSQTRLRRIPSVAAELVSGRYRRFGLGPLGCSSAAADLLL